MTSVQILHLITRFGRMHPDLRNRLIACQTPEEVGRIACDWLLRQDFSTKPAFVEQLLSLVLSEVDQRAVGMALGVDYSIPSVIRRAFEEIMSRGEEHDGPSLEVWRGNWRCARLVRVLAETDDACGGLAWADDLERKGYRTVTSRPIGALAYEQDYEYASLANTTLEQLANFCDQIGINEMGQDDGTRPHRALAGLLFSHVGRVSAHAVLFRIAQVGTLGELLPNLYPLSPTNMGPLVACALQCDYQASEAARMPAHYACFYISHIALAGLLVDVLGGEHALVCMQELARLGSMARLKPEVYGLPSRGEDEWNWRL